MKKIKLTLAKSLIGLATCLSGPLTFAETIELDMTTIYQMKSDYAKSPSALAYIDKLVPYTKVDEAALDIINLNLISARNADLEAMAEGREATAEDVERHKGYIVKSRSVANQVQVVPQESESQESDSTASNSKAHGHSLQSVAEDIEDMTSMLGKVLSTACIILALLFAFQLFFSARDEK